MILHDYLIYLLAYKPTNMQNENMFGSSVVVEKIQKTTYHIQSCQKILWNFKNLFLNLKIMLICYCIGELEFDITKYSTDARAGCYFYKFSKIGLTRYLFNTARFNMNFAFFNSNISTAIKSLLLNIWPYTWFWGCCTNNCSSQLFYSSIALKSNCIPV